LYLFVRIECRPPFGVVDKTYGQGALQFAAASFIQNTALQSCSQDV
jgi:hypothetical protein